MLWNSGHSFFRFENRTARAFLLGACRAIAGLGVATTGDDVAVAMAFPPVIEVSGFNGSNGFRINGQASNDTFGISVSSAGDFNGDGWNDFIVGSLRAGIQYTGAAHVVFGSLARVSPVNTSGLNGDNGFRINGQATFDYCGLGVGSAGDINGDGFEDVIVGAQGADLNGNWSGAAYVIFGKDSGFSNPFSLASLSGNNGFTIIGEAGSALGASVGKAGDVNGDGFDDIIVGAHGGNKAYVIYGKNTGFSSSVPTISLTGANGFAINGSGNQFGRSVGAAGDINGDGFDDVIIGTFGTAYVILGQSNLTSPIDVLSLSGSNGFRVQGGAGGDYLGCSVSSAGDINGDGLSDVIIGADQRANAGTGKAYTVFGKPSGFSPVFDISALAGSNGFAIVGEVLEGRLGRSVGCAGDMNGDGFDDVIVGAVRARANDGACYVILGKGSGFNNQLNVSSLNGTNGFKIFGESAGQLGYSVAPVGDVNGDLLGDVLLGGPDTLPNGAAYVLYFDSLVIAQAPGPINFSVPEDQPLTVPPAISAQSLRIGASGITWSSTPASNGVATVSGNGASPPFFSYRPATNYFGPDGFGVSVTDGASVKTIPVSIAVTPVNDSPQFVAGPDAVVPEDAGDQLISGWATAIVSGPPNESNQSYSFRFLTNSNAGLFAAGPSVSNAGALSFRPISNANGIAVLTLVLSDNGGENSNSAMRSFSITISPVNDPPTFIPGPSMTLDEDSGPQSVVGWATSISPGPNDELGQLVQFEISNSNPNLFINQPALSPSGTLTFTSASDAFGTANLTTILSDDGGGSSNSTPRDTVITINNVNDAPVITNGPGPVSVAIDGNGPFFAPSVGAIDIDSAVLVWTLARSASNGVAQVSGAGAAPILAYQPLVDFVGHDSFGVQVSDGALSDRITVDVTVNPPGGETSLGSSTGGSSSGLTGTTGEATSGTSVAGTSSGTTSGSVAGSTSGGSTGGFAGGSSGTTSGAVGSGLMLLDWIVVIKKPKPATKISAGRGVSAAARVENTGLPKRSTAVRAQAALLTGTSTSPAWVSAKKTGRVNRRGIAKFKFEKISLAADLPGGEPVRLWMRASTNFSLSTSPTSQIQFSIR